MSIGDEASKGYPATITFATLIKQYVKLQSQVISQVRTVASSISAATPGKFLLMQFSMSQVSQVGESISNLVATVNTMIGAVVRNLGK